MKKYRSIVGIDEVGRGPLAGPATVCAYVLPASVADALPRQKDSKQLSKQARESLARMLRGRGDAQFALSSVSAATIDKIGIAKAIKLAINRAMRKLSVSSDTTFIFLDGGLHAPKQYAQQTVVHGDATIPIIAYASIVAKVHRDKYMRRKAIEYPAYGFDRHVGYGTRSHIQMIRKHGVSPLHRKTFLRHILSHHG